MNIESVKLVWFSPTGTSRAVVEAVARGFGISAVVPVDITRPDVRNKPLVVAENELLVVGVPVYMGRVPALLGDWFGALRAMGAPAVCVAVYGNRAYENALLELKDLLAGQGAVPVAGGAYIGEHSFSDPATPTAHGRPDQDDLLNAQTFGRKVREKLDAVSSVSQLGDLDVPGERPYGGITTLWDVDFIEVGEDCVQCGQCADVCPVGAIDPQSSAAIDVQACITCCACIKVCPQNARTMKPGPVMDARNRLNNLYQEPRQPEFFL